MLEGQKLLVVDDEEAICEGCRRIFTRQGFVVEKSSDAEVGLQMAEDNEYAAILLDIKMPTMTGIEFLEHLRSKRPQVPVILMTGYPSVPNAISAIRLGASGYVTKPFTPEEISKAVHERLQSPAGNGNEGQTVESKPDAWTPAAEGLSFWRDSWVQHGQDGTARIGTLTPRCQANVIKSVRLPKIGETVYRGLPMAAVERENQEPVIIPAPLSGTIVSVNDRLAQSRAALWEDPCGRGWIAGICPTRYEEEIEHCSLRRLIVLNADPASAALQQRQLAALGCQTRVAGNWEELASPLQDRRFGAVLFDAASFGSAGPALVARINATAPAMKVVLVAGSGSPLEAAYRAQRIFYYAVEPFADAEITEIIQALYRVAAVGTSKKTTGSTSGAQIATINMVNRNGTRVRLMPDAGLLERDAGLGQAICQKLLGRLLPVEASLGEWVITPTNIVKMASRCDRLVVLVTRDVDRLPGSLLRDTKAEFVAVTGADVGNVTTLIVQPARQGGGLAGLDDATLAALSEHIVNDLTSY